MNKPNFRRWHDAGFGPELLPIIPVGAKLTFGTTVRESHLGKVPGVLTDAGTWSGLGGQWSLHLNPKVADLKLWGSWGAGIGMQGRKYPGLDIDVDDAELAALIGELAADYLGMGPIRTREGSPRRLHMFQCEDGTLRKTRLAFVAKGAKHAVELLAAGQQYVVEGPHPKGGSYQWDTYPTPADLPTINAADVEKFYSALREKLELAGCTIEQTAAAGLSGSRKGLDDLALHAPSPEHVLAVLKAWRPEGMGHDEFVAAVAAIKASLGPDREDYFGDVLEWAPGGRADEEEETRKRWDSITDSALGWDWLSSKSGQGVVAAQDEFDDGASEGIETPADPGTAARAKMVKRYVYVRALDRYIDTLTGEILTSKGFNTRNTKVAPFGKSGADSAEAKFQNDPDARKTQTATYRPGKGVIVHEDINGSIVPCVNLYRPSALKPAASASDADVSPWLEHVNALFGEPGEETREHFLNWCAFAVQKLGVKINHALVLLGEHGVGKDTVLLPIVRALGRHNVNSIDPERLTGPFTDFLQAELIIVNEMMNYSKRETYNHIKPFIAEPPEWLEVNKKHQQPYYIPNKGLWVFFTNHENAIALEDGDRRFWIARMLIEKPRSDEYYSRIYDFFDFEDGVEKCMAWLLARDVSKFKPKAPPPTTDAKEEMLEHSRPAASKWISEQLAEGGTFHGRELLTVGELLEHSRTEWGAPDKTFEKDVTAALRRAGYDALEGKFRIGTNSVRMWTNSARPKMLTQLGASRLKIRYEEDRAKAPGARGA